MDRFRSFEVITFASLSHKYIIIFHIHSSSVNVDHGGISGPTALSKTYRCGRTRVLLATTSKYYY